MTENHHQDKALLDEIERVLNNQKSDNELLALLVSTKPKASTDFQNNLEDKLIEQLTANNTDIGDTIMTEFNDKPKHKKKPSRLPFTLVAALIAIVLVGGLILFTTSNRGTPYDSYEIPAEFALTATQLINDATATGIARDTGQNIVVTSTPITDPFMLTATSLVQDATATANANIQQVQATATPGAFMLTATAIIEDTTATASANNNNQQIQASPTFTPTAMAIENANLQDEPEDFGRIIIALRDIELNEVITDEMVTTVQYDVSDAWLLAESNAGTFYYSEQERIIGQRASTFIPSYQPIHSNNITESQNCQDNIAGCATIEGSVLMASITDRSALALPLGTQVDIIAALQYIDIGDESQAIVDTSDLPLDIVPTITMETIISNTTLLDKDSTGDHVLVTIALSPQDAIVLQYMLEAGIPLRFAPHIEQAEQTNQAIQFSREYPQTENGLAIISISLEQVNTDSVVNIGDTFDIQFSILPAQESLIIATPTPQVGDVIYNHSISPFSNCCRILEIENTTVLYVGRGTDDFPNPRGDDSLFLSITVNPDDAWIVDWYANNGANFNLIP